MPMTMKYQAPVPFEHQSGSRSVVFGDLLRITRDPNLLAVTLFCLLGLLITICLVQFPLLSSVLPASFAQLS